MMRSIIPLIAILLFFMEPVFSLFSPIAYGEDFYILVPRFVIVHLIFVAIYVNKKQAIIYGIIFGLLYDMFYIDIIGLYAFLYPLICFFAANIIRLLYKNIVIVMIITLLLIGLLELFSYGFASLIMITSIGFNEFLTSRLVPTILANSLFIFMYSWFFKSFIEKKLLTKRNKLL